MTPQRRPTQVDIARRVGVSQATVSLVISGGPASAQVAEHTRRAVLEAAAELGYAVNSVARSLKGGRNRLLGVFTFEPVFPVDQRDFYFPFLLGIEEATAEFGYDLLLFSSASAGGDRRIYASGVNRLKLAPEFVFRVTVDYRNAAVVRAAIRLANELGLDVIAEGVETEAQLRFLMAAGCEQAQGFYFSPPVPAAKATALLRAGRLEPHAPLRPVASSAA